LSAVALYLSLPKLESDSATLSDRMFVFAYMIVSLMIFISILRVNRRMANPTARAILKFVHIVLIPASVVAATYYVYLMSGVGV
jgi:presenilin-like A22 family membrane protease